jgi:hypothetical protein
MIGTDTSIYRFQEIDLVEIGAGNNIYWFSQMDPVVISTKTSI